MGKINIYNSDSECYNIITSQLTIPSHYNKTYLNPRKYHQTVFNQVQIIDSDLSDEPIYIKSNYIYSSYELDQSMIEYLTNKLRDNSISVTLVNYSDDKLNFDEFYSSVEISRDLGDGYSYKELLYEMTGSDSTSSNRIIYTQPSDEYPYGSYSYYILHKDPRLICISNTYYLIKAYIYSLKDRTYLGLKFKSNKLYASKLTSVIFKNKDIIIDYVINEFKNRVKNR